MNKLMNIITSLHKKTERDYPARMADNKIACMKIAKKYGYEYWDGDRRYGYGGYKYDGRQEQVARALIQRYHLGKKAKILDVGCGKGFLLYEFKKLLPDCQVNGFDISRYALDNAKEEIRGDLLIHRAEDKHPFKDKEFDLVISINTLHNLPVEKLKPALREIERVGKEKYITVESFRNENELFNLECWALTCESFFSPPSWEWLFKEFGYKGDYEFIYFE